MEQVHQPTRTADEEDDRGGYAGRERSEEAGGYGAQAARNPAGNGCDQWVGHEKAARGSEQLSEPARAGGTENWKAHSAFGKVGEHGEEARDRA